MKYELLQDGLGMSLYLLNGPHYLHFRMPIDVETLPDVYYFDDYEKFYSEIAAFHLDRCGNNITYYSAQMCDHPCVDYRELQDAFYWVSTTAYNLNHTI